MIELNFKEYELSKSVLLSHLIEDQIKTETYELIKYCKISIGYCLNTKDMFILKPKDIIKVKWNYNDHQNPKCYKMIIKNKEYDVYWKNEKISIWISKNTKKI